MTTFMAELITNPRSRSREIVIDPSLLDTVADPTTVEPITYGQRRNLRPLPLPTVLANLREFHADCVINNGSSVHVCGLPPALQTVNPVEWDLATYIQLTRG